MYYNPNLNLTLTLTLTIILIIFVENSKSQKNDFSWDFIRADSNSIQYSQKDWNSTTVFFMSQLCRRLLKVLKKTETDHLKS